VSVTRPIPTNLRGLPARGTRPLSDWIARPLFGLLLAALAVEADFGGTEYFALLIAVGAALAAREWHRLVGSKPVPYETMLCAAVVLAALAVLVLRPEAWFAWALLGAGVLAVAGVALLRGESAIWHGAGVLYIGVPALSLVIGRAVPPNGAYLIVGLFIVVWLTDTGALIAGNLLKGPKLAPVLSPNKTWSGTLGGIAAAAAGEALYVGILGGHAATAAAYGAGLAVVAHAGDLFESFVKRRFHKKDSGTMIPGHGGVLDRIDSMLAAAIGMTVLALVLHVDLLFGAQP
jgi:phosphatidate cytidylyltransferase